MKKKKYDSLKKLMDEGFKTIPCGSSWGILNKN